MRKPALAARQGRDAPAGGARGSRPRGARENLPLTRTLPGTMFRSSSLSRAGSRHSLRSSAAIVAEASIVDDWVARQRLKPS